jgi:hypothetical protein
LEEEIEKIQDGGSAAIAVEIIPNPDRVSRMIDFPHKYSNDRELIWETIFMFSKGRGESVNWEKYCSLPDEAHARGCQWEREKRATQPQKRYEGYIAAVTEHIRNINTAAGHGFDVLHKPEEGIFHAEIHYRPNAASTQPLTPGEKADLKLWLKREFAQLEPHSCE